MRRALLYFDGRNVLFPYIDHRYTMDHPFPHTHGNIAVFVDRISANFHDRNTSAIHSETDRILRIHALDTTTNCSRNNDIFSEYQSLGMSSLEYYYESHSIQFFKIFFFFLELQWGGVETDKDDIWEGPIPFEIIPEDIQAIVYNDTAYREYLLRRVNNICSNDVESRENVTGRCPTRLSNFFEQDLIILIWTSISNIFRTKITSTTTTTRAATTTTEITTTMKKSLKRPRKGSVFVNVYGKHFLKKQKTFNDECCENQNKKSDENGSKKIIHSTKRLHSMRTYDEYYGYIVDNSSDFRYTVNTPDEISKFLSMIRLLFGGSNIHTFHRM